jgi:Response regulator containing a CheY-like receiver domain and an HTH DNA-binding domain
MKNEEITVLVFSDNSARRRAVIEGVGLKPDKDLPTINWVEAASADGVAFKYEENAPSVLVLDSETVKEGGMSVARDLKTQQNASEPMVLLVARPQDKWLADWAGAESIVYDPLDPLDLQEALSKAIRAAA